MSPHHITVWLALSGIWLAGSVWCLVGVLANPQLRINYARQVNLTHGVAFVIVAIASTYVWTHAITPIYIWLASLPFLAGASYIARRHRKQVMAPR